MDNGNLDNRKEMIKMLEERMRRMYPGWSRESVTYRKDGANGEEYISSDSGATEKEIEVEISKPGSRMVPPEGFAFLGTKEESRDVASKRVKAWG